MSKSGKKKPYCSTCHKAGLPFEKYTNHWTKASSDADSQITCPTILNSKCGYCRKLGHWTKFCPKLTEKKDLVVIEEVKDKVVSSSHIIYDLKHPWTDEEYWGRE